MTALSIEDIKQYTQYIMRLYSFACLKFLFYMSIDIVWIIQI